MHHSLFYFHMSARIYNIVFIMLKSFIPFFGNSKVCFKTNASVYRVHTLMNSYSAENRSASASSCCACKYQIVILSLQFCVYSVLLKLFFFLIREVRRKRSQKGKWEGAEREMRKMKFNFMKKKKKLMGET